MTTIDLHEYYLWHNPGSFIEVTDEVAMALRDFTRRETAQRVKEYRYKARYSIDRGDGIEHDALNVPILTDEIFESHHTTELIHVAIASLPGKQAKRIYAHFFLDMSKTAIARAEGVSEKSIRQSIKSGISRLEKVLKKIL